MPITNQIRCILVVIIASLQMLMMKFVTDHTRSITAIPILMFIGEYINLAIYYLCLQNPSFVAAHKAQINSKFYRLRLIIPTIFDIIGTISLNFGLIFIPSPLYMMLKGLGLIFVVLISKLLLHKQYSLSKYIGIIFIFIGVLIYGIFSTVFPQNESAANNNYLLGITLVSFGYAMYGFQYVVTEKLLTNDNPHPLEMVGIEGLAGSIFFIVLLPISYAIRGRIFIGKNFCSQFVLDKSIYSRDCFTDIFTINDNNISQFINFPFLLSILFTSRINWLMPLLSTLLIFLFALYNFLLVDLIGHTSATTFAILDPMKMILISMVSTALLSLSTHMPWSKLHSYIVQNSIAIVISICFTGIGYLIFYEKLKMRCLKRRNSENSFLCGTSTDTSLSLKDSIISGEECVSEESKKAKLHE